MLAGWNHLARDEVGSLVASDHRVGQTRMKAVERWASQYNISLALLLRGEPPPNAHACAGYTTMYMPKTD